MAGQALFQPRPSPGPVGPDHFEDSRAGLFIQVQKFAHLADDQSFVDPLDLAVNIGRGDPYPEKVCGKGEGVTVSVQDHAAPRLLLLGHILLTGRLGGQDFAFSNLQPVKTGQDR